MSLEEEFFEPITPSWGRTAWLLDPGPFIDIAFDMNFQHFAFRSRYGEYNNATGNHVKWVDLYARGRPWSVIWFPPSSDFAVLFTSEKGWKQHAAVWRVWRPKINDFEMFDRLWYNPPPAGEIVGVYGARARYDAMPVEVIEGQEHRVVVAGYPQDEWAWSEIALFLQHRQNEHPEWTIHAHGQKSLGRTIGIAAKSFDHPVRLGWDNGYPRVLMPNGMVWQTAHEPGKTHRLWLSAIGVQWRELLKLTGKELSREVYETNLASIRWALLNWDRAWDFRRSILDDEELEEADIDWNPKTLPVRIRKTREERENLDRWLCDSCSLQVKCPYAREGSVCIVPDSEPADMVEMFGTRNSSQIVTALSALVQNEARRYQRGAKEESDLAASVEDGDFDEVKDDGTRKRVRKVVLSDSLTKLGDKVFRHGATLAKLVDPALARGFGPQINIGLIAGQQPQQLTPQAIMNAVAGVLEGKGIDPSTASEEDVQKVLIELGAPIEATGSEV